MFTREPPPFSFDLTVVSDQLAFVWDAQWYPVTGVGKVDFTADVRNVTVVGTSAGVSIKPAIQYATTRTDRPGTGGVISDGVAITGNDLKHYQQTLAGSGEFFFRRGIGYQLTGGTFARAQGLLYTAFNTLGQVLPAQEIVFQPLNVTAAVSVFPLGGGRAIPAQGVSAAKLVAITMGNLNNTLQWQVAGRAFNDQLARGNWTLLEGTSWRTPAAGDDGANTGEVELATNLSLASKQWVELGLAVRKAADTDPVSRVTFHIVPALKYTT